MGIFGRAKLVLFSKYMPYTPGVKILDLGCGPATNTYLYCPGDYLGIDISDRYIKSAQRQFPNHKFMCCDLTKLTSLL